MKQQLLRLFSLPVFFMPCIVGATPITEFWTSTVTDISNVIDVAIGDTFTWQVSFDNESQRITLDGDGPDGIANTADDVFGQGFCTIYYSGAEFCTLPGFSNPFLATGSFSFDLAWSGTGFPVFDEYDFNSEWTYDDNGGGKVRELYADDQYFVWEDTHKLLT